MIKVAKSAPVARKVRPSTNLKKVDAFGFSSIRLEREISVQNKNGYSSGRSYLPLLPFLPAREWGSIISRKSFATQESKSGSTASKPGSLTENQVWDIMKGVLQSYPKTKGMDVKPETAISSILDSLDEIELAVALEQQLGLVFPEDIGRFNTLGDMVAYVLRRNVGLEKEKK